MDVLLTVTPNRYIFKRTCNSQSLKLDDFPSPKWEAMEGLELEDYDFWVGPCPSLCRAVRGAAWEVAGAGPWVPRCQLTEESTGFLNNTQQQPGQCGRLLIVLHFTPSCCCPCPPEGTRLLASFLLPLPYAAPSWTISCDHQTKPVSPCAIT